jgi:hypothetical protein
MEPRGIVPLTDYSEASANNQLAPEAPEPLAYSLAHESQKPVAESPSTRQPVEPLDPDLARVVKAWTALPEAIRRAMLALVESAGTSKANKC